MKLKYELLELVINLDGRIPRQDKLDAEVFFFALDDGAFDRADMVNKLLDKYRARV